MESDHWEELPLMEEITEFTATHEQRERGGWVGGCVFARARTDWILSHLNGTEFFFFFFWLWILTFSRHLELELEGKVQALNCESKDWKIEQHSLLHCIRPACFEPHKHSLSSTFQEVHGQSQRSFSVTCLYISKIWAVELLGGKRAQCWRITWKQVKN